MSHFSPLWRPYTQEKTAAPPLLVRSARGAHLELSDGRRLLDGISSWWLTTHGHCRPEITEALKKQCERLDQVTFANFTHEAADELGELLINATPSGLTRVFLSDNGSTSVEVALKLALQSCAQRGFPERKKFLTFANAYHGDTVGAMSVSERGEFTRSYRPALFEVLRVEHVKELELVLEKEHSSIAAVILEPLIQAAGGMIFWEDDEVRKVALLCRKFSVLLIFDEVMTGFGRTGAMFAMDRLGLTPDLLCLSKGLTGGVLPLGATLVTENIYEAFYSKDPAARFFHGHSFTGNPLACAAAVANLKIWRNEDVSERLAAIERVQRSEIGKLEKRLPIFNARVSGTIAAFELDTEDKDYFRPLGGEVVSAALERGLYLRPLGNTLYLMPPYCVSASELEHAWTVLEESVAQCLL